MRRNQTRLKEKGQMAALVKALDDKWVHHEPSEQSELSFSLERVSSEEAIDLSNMTLCSHYIVMNMFENVLTSVQQMAPRDREFCRA